MMLDVPGWAPVPGVVAVRHVHDGTYNRHDFSHRYIGRRVLRYGFSGSPWANPYPLHSERERPTVLAQYRAYIHKTPMLRHGLLSLDGCTLYCWCKAPRPGLPDRACHGDVLAELVASYRRLSGAGVALRCGACGGFSVAVWVLPGFPDHHYYRCSSCRAFTHADRVSGPSYRNGSLVMTGTGASTITTRRSASAV